ncbi:MAG TPA: acyl-CoA carboxylase subunit epsilon [Phycicoccus sp.]|nr:acyl-CoA carboxylase subunit epsilon [Phycicoccus sp.]
MPSAPDPSPAPDTPQPAGPSITVHGDATPEQVAALVAVLSAVGGGDDGGSARGIPSGWSNHARAVGVPANPRHGGWRASGGPR